MRLNLRLLALAALLAANPSGAKDAVPSVAPASVAASQPAKARQFDESQLKEHGMYLNRSGQRVHSPAHTTDGAVPPGASAQCRDGTYSFSQRRSGTCSHHGGVASWL